MKMDIQGNSYVVDLYNAGLFVLSNYGTQYASLSCGTPDGHSGWSSITLTNVPSALFIYANFTISLNTSTVQQYIDLMLGGMLTLIDVSSSIQRAPPLCFNASYSAATTARNFTC